MLLSQFILAFIRIPAWILYLGWNVWPQVFVYEPMDAPRDSLVSPWSLERQLESGAISVEARIAFADRLLDGMYKGELARWDERRNALLAVCIDQFSLAMEDEVARGMLGALGEKHNALLDVLGSELLTSIVEPQTGQPQDGLVDRPRNLLDRFHNPYVLVRDLVDESYFLQHPRETGTTWDDRRPLICNRSRLMPNTRAIGLSSEIDYEDLRQDLCLDLAIDAGFANDISMVYFPPDASKVGRTEFAYRTSGLSLALGLSCEPAKPDVVDRLVEWAGSDDPSERTFAFWTADFWTRNPGTLTGPSDETVKRLLDHAVDSLHLMNVLWVHDDDPYTVRKSAQFAIARLDRTGEVSIPLIRDWVVGGDDWVPHAGYFGPTADKRLITGWAEHLSDLAFSNRVDVRRWLALAIPTRVGTPADQRIDKVIAVLLKDGDEEVRDQAQDAFDERLVTVEPDHRWIFSD